MRSVCPQAGKKGMTSARLSELYQKVLREALDGVPCAVPWSVPESHSDILSSLSLSAEWRKVSCRSCRESPVCLTGSSAPPRGSVCDVSSRQGEIGRLATAVAAVVPITTSLSLGTSSRFRDEPAHPPDDCISARHRQLGRRDRAGWESIGCLCSSEHRRWPRIYGSSRWEKTAKMERDIAKYVGAGHPIYVT